eukprot:TRINITY_DN1788_c3_g1_i1.p2 TRINITY_DN1788_c3_g1~~TRINITY_DN1788_c3_g1_i1.p2  ORF type:complete len:411 (+),score=108.62 TRINITY_DN1788_c3_g1_i1:50-1234(+)
MAAGCVANFVARLRLNSQAENALRDLGDESLNLIRELGDMVDGARDPSGVVIAFARRIVPDAGLRDVLNGGDQPPVFSDAQDYEPHGYAANVADFVALNSLDSWTARALDSLWMQDAAQCQDVMNELGLIQGARNSNAIVMKRLRALRDDASAAGRVGDLPARVDEWCALNGLDGRTVEAVRGLHPEHAAALIERLGVIAGARNNNAVVMAALKRGPLAPAPPPVPPPPPPPPHAVAPQHVPAGPVAGAGYVQPLTLAEFVSANGLDERMQQSLERMPPDQLQVVIDTLGVISGARNPNAIVTATMRKVLDGEPTGARTGRPAGGAAVNHDQIAAFVHSNGLDQQAEKALREAPQAAAVVIAQLGIIEHARNPNAIVLAALRRATGTRPGYHPY